MCLAIPMQVSEVEGDTARCTRAGISRDVSLFLLPDQEISQGDYVLVHVGYAIRKLERQQALETLELIGDTE